MRLTASACIVFAISLTCAALALVPVFGVVVALPVSGFLLMTIALGLPTTGALLKGV